jgi:hypothetical protein
LFVDAVATRQIIAPALNTLIGDPKKIFEASYPQMLEAIRALGKGDQKRRHPQGSRLIDLPRALVGVANVTIGRGARILNHRPWKMIKPKVDWMNGLLVQDGHCYAPGFKTGTRDGG